MGLRTFAIFGLVLIATLCNTLSAEFTVSNRQKYLEELYLKSLHLLNNGQPREALPYLTHAKQNIDQHQHEHDSGE